ncbi:hypothetical protein HPG69_017732 [Diceros bicornis minor]|uniref:phosphopyruvate hydratase n=1 Tax=Diceros bicornis minor TaxID=77932 RepID=A0A7J7FGR7_DICBM|nr:hypothetical protein HPG69_017732 [Diceros bicornis minor]
MGAEAYLNQKDALEKKYGKYTSHKSFIKDYPVVSTEDALDQDDWEARKKFSTSVGGIQVVGDGLMVASLK